MIFFKIVQTDKLSQISLNTLVHVTHTTIVHV